MVVEHVAILNYDVRASRRGSNATCPVLPIVARPMLLLIISHNAVCNRDIVASVYINPPAIGTTHFAVLNNDVVRAAVHQNPDLASVSLQTVDNDPTFPG